MPGADYWKSITAAFSEIDWQTVVAALALVFSYYTFRRTQRIAEKQAGLVEDQKRLNQLLLAKEQEAASTAKRADVSARMIKMANGYRVKVFNRGNVDARNVRILIPEETTLLIRSDVQAKFPLERLEPQAGVELIATVHLGSPGKQSISLMWDDEHADGNTKLAYLTT